MYIHRVSETQAQFSARGYVGNVEGSKEAIDAFIRATDRPASLTVNAPPHVEEPMPEHNWFDGPTGNGHGPDARRVADERHGAAAGAQHGGQYGNAQAGVQGGETPMPEPCWD